MEFMYIIAGVLSGIIAGMGMGGGTLLIPILVMILDVDMKVSQLTNLLCFIPLSIVALLGLVKDKIVNFKYAFLLGIPAMVASIFASYLSTMTSSEELKKYYGIFLIVLGSVYLIKTIVSVVKQLVRYSK